MNESKREVRVVHANDLVGYTLIALLFNAFGKKPPPIHEVFDLERRKS